MSHTWLLPTTNEVPTQQVTLTLPRNLSNKSFEGNSHTNLPENSHVDGWLNGALFRPSFFGMEHHLGPIFSEFLALAGCQFRD